MPNQHLPPFEFSTLGTRGPHGPTDLSGYLGIDLQEQVTLDS
eukprot:SAG31_NODE_29025_length_402_cov_0.580858_2_plen_41_part_01